MTQNDEKNDKKATDELSDEQLDMAGGATPLTAKQTEIKSTPEKYINPDGTTNRV